jgi:hypothetical protein
MCPIHRPNEQVLTVFTAEFRWEDNTPFFTSFWANGEPDLGTTVEEACGIIRKTGFQIRYFDQSCAEKRAYICKAARLELPAECQIGGTGVRTFAADTPLLGEDVLQASAPQSEVVLTDTSNVMTS